MSLPPSAGSNSPIMWPSGALTAATCRNEPIDVRSCNWGKNRQRPSFLHWQTRAHRGKRKGEGRMFVWRCWCSCVVIRIATGRLGADSCLPFNWVLNGPIQDSAHAKQPRQGRVHVLYCKLKEWGISGSILRLADITGAFQQSSNPLILLGPSSRRSRTAANSPHCASGVGATKALTCHSLLAPALCRKGLLGALPIAL